MRFYTHLGREFSYDLWKREVTAGHTFVSSGPMLDFTVNGHIPGDAVKLLEPSTLSIKAKKYGSPQGVMQVLTRPPIPPPFM